MVRFTVNNNKNNNMNLMKVNLYYSAQLFKDSTLVYCDTKEP